MANSASRHLVLTRLPPLAAHSQLNTLQEEWRIPACAKDSGQKKIFPPLMLLINFVCFLFFFFSFFNFLELLLSPQLGED